MFLLYLVASTSWWSEYDLTRALVTVAFVTVAMKMYDVYIFIATEKTDNKLPFPWLDGTTRGINGLVPRPQD